MLFLEHGKGGLLNSYSKSGEKTLEESRTEGNKANKVWKMEGGGGGGVVQPRNPKFTRNGPELTQSRHGLLSYLNFRKEFAEIG